MPRELKRDPIAETYRIWVEHGWEDAAGALAVAGSIVRVQQLLVKTADQVLAPLGLTFSRFEALTILYFDDQGSMPLARLAKLLQIHQTSITNLIDKLEAQGLIERTPHPTDRRITIARITPDGRSLARKSIRRINSELYAKFALTPDEIRLLIVVLARLRQSWGDFTADEVWDTLKDSTAVGELPDGGTAPESTQQAPGS